MLDFRFARGNLDALPSLAAELVRIPVDVIVTDSTNGTVAAFGATRTIPIVMATTSGDPVALGVATSIARPGGNVTGMLFRSFELSGRRLQLLKVAVPATARRFCSIRRVPSGRPGSTSPRMQPSFLA